jgi:hypothetical protein
MKALLLLIVLGAGGYYTYQHFSGNEDAAPEVIENPVYADIRIDVKAGGRELQFALFGRMADQRDCDQRAARMWGEVIEGCKMCVQQTHSCKAELEPRYRRLFEDTPIHSTYMSFDRGSPKERDGRMVIFGLTADEGDAICDQMISGFKSRYTGRIECVKARRD